ncbi:MAG TPA: polysaccharide biosynthesis tyrosine autokinase [Solirubrobacteraceae bacterium]
MQQGSETTDLGQALSVLRRRLPLILLCVVLGAGAAYAYSKHEVKKYVATASVVYNYNSLSQQIAGLSAGSLSSSSLLAQQASNLELARGGDTAAKTARIVGHGLTAVRVATSVSVVAQGESSILDITATSTSPMLAAEIANTYARQFVHAQQGANRRYLKSALAIVEEQLAALTKEQRVGNDGLQLQNRAQTLSLLSRLNYGNVQVGQEAFPPASPASPKVTRDTGLGLLLGLVLGLAFAFSLERLDRTIRRPEDLERLYRLPALGAVPKSRAFARKARSKKHRRTPLPPADAEAFALIRAHLRFFAINQRLRTIIVASAAPGEGKSTIARHLAEAEARSGARVLLLEVDLRHPTLAQQLDIQPGPGLADVLIGAIPKDEATQTVTLEASGGGGAERTLDVLTAGAVLPPNPGELLESHAMADLLARAQTTYDLVILDTPPSTVVSDALPLLSKVDGVVVVGWVGRSRRDAAERFHDVLASSGASLLGVIGNGSTVATPGDYSSAQGDGPTSPAAASMNGASSREKLVVTTKG